VLVDRLLSDRCGIVETTKFSEIIDDFKLRSKMACLQSMCGLEGSQGGFTVSCSALGVRLRNKLFERDFGSTHSDNPRQTTSKGTNQIVYTWKSQSARSLIQTNPVQHGENCKVFIDACLTHAPL
jgi:hypothetical protein